MIHAIQHLKMAADDYRRMSTPNANTITEYTANKNAELADEFELAAEALRKRHNEGFNEGVLAEVFRQFLENQAPVEDAPDKVSS